jgi:hypothetical protein
MPYLISLIIAGGEKAIATAPYFRSIAEICKHISAALRFTNSRLKMCVHIFGSSTLNLIPNKIP